MDVRSARGPTTAGANMLCRLPTNNRSFGQRARCARAAYRFYRTILHAHARALLACACCRRMSGSRLLIPQRALTLRLDGASFARATWDIPNARGRIPLHLPAPHIRICNCAHCCACAAPARIPGAARTLPALFCAPSAHRHAQQRCLDAHSAGHTPARTEDHNGIPCAGHIFSCWFCTYMGSPPAMLILCLSACLTNAHSL